MTKQELLTNMAKRCSTWAECLGTYKLAGVCSGLMRDDWLTERERLRLTGDVLLEIGDLDD